MRRTAALTLAAALLSAGHAWAWGATGHRLIGRAAIEALPPELPAFLQSPLAVAQVGELAREPDRSRTAGQPHDGDLDPGHFLALDDEGRTLAGLALADLPPNRESFDVAVAKAGADPLKAGFLWYNLLDGYQQLVKDFGYWRADRAGALHAGRPEDRAWFAADQRLREALVIRDLGYWSHFVGDASQPMHVSIHYNGWGPFPNPHGYTQDKIHGPFEGVFVRDNVTPTEVKRVMTAYTPCATPVPACVAAYLDATRAKVEPVYALWTAGGFQPGDPRGRAFAVERVAAGASELRDLVVDAWRASADASVGYPAVSVRAVESGQTPAPFGPLYGED